MFPFEIRIPESTFAFDNPNCKSRYRCPDHDYHPMPAQERGFSRLALRENTPLHYHTLPPTLYAMRGSTIGSVYYHLKVTIKRSSGKFPLHHSKEIEIRILIPKVDPLAFTTGSTTVYKDIQIYNWRNGERPQFWITHLLKRSNRVSVKFSVTAWVPKAVHAKEKFKPRVFLVSRTPPTCFKDYPGNESVKYGGEDGVSNSTGVVTMSEYELTVENSIIFNAKGAMDSLRGTHHFAEIKLPKKTHLSFDLASMRPVTEENKGDVIFENVLLTDSHYLMDITDQLPEVIVPVPRAQSFSVCGMRDRFYIGAHFHFKRTPFFGKSGHMFVTGRDNLIE